MYTAYLFVLFLHLCIKLKLQEAISTQHNLEPLLIHEEDTKEINAVSVF